MIIDVIMSMIMIMIMIERSRHHKHIKYFISRETETVDGFRRVQGPHIHPYKIILGTFFLGEGGPAQVVGIFMMWSGFFLPSPPLAHAK